MGGVPIADVSRPGRRSGHTQVTAGGDPGLAHSFSWPRHHAVGTMDPCPQPHTYTQAGGTKDKISILYLKCPMYLKLKFQISRL
jgi:hypothetical protein